jgi:pimeloyl-ACP methyl ester carboxylesterase
MPRLQVDGASIHYEESGAGPEAIVFAHGLLWDGRMFEAQVAALSRRYRCVTFDFRGQGGSEVTAGGYDMDTLAADAAALIGALGLAPCHFAGLSMGGFVGMRLAIEHPELLRSLILIETTAEPEAPRNRRKYAMLNFVARRFGLGLVAGQVMQVMFGRKFLRDPARAAARQEYRRRLLANDRTGITRAVAAVIDREGVAGRLDRIALPTLVIVGDQDVGTPPALAERLHAGIAGSRLQVIAGAGHSSVLEEPEAVTAAIAGFLG